MTACNITEHTQLIWTIFQSTVLFFALVAKLPFEGLVGLKEFVNINFYIHYPNYRIVN